MIFGIDWGLLGYCPGTQLGALGKGRVDALWGIAGMLCGAALFAETYPFLKRTMIAWGDLGKITIPQIVHINHWIIVVIFIISVMVLFRFFETKKL